MANAPNELSFLPDDYLERKVRRRTNAICAILAIAAMGSIGTAFSLSERSMRDIEKRHAEVDRAYNEAALRIEQADRMRAQQRQVVRRAELAAALLEKVPRSNILAEYTNALPAGLSLLDLAMESKERNNPAPAAAPAQQTTFTQKPAGGAPAAAPQPVATSYDVYLKLTGIAHTDVQVAQFISKLNHSKLLKDVNLVVSESFAQGDQNLRQFKIEMTLNPDAEVKPTPEPAAKTATANVNSER